MASVSDQLLAALDELVSDQLERFKWHLRIDYRVSASDLEKVDNAPKTVDLMTARFGPEEAVNNTVKILRKMNQNHLAEELKRKHEQDTVLRTREDFLQYSLQLSLDLNTVHKYLLLSQNNTVITNSDTVQKYPDHPDRFDRVCQVLCGESVCGRCYWEIEWRGNVEISVSYKSIRRKGGGAECEFGANDQSWSLFCSPHSYSFWHNNIVTDLSVKPIIIRRTGEFDGFRRTGVFVDPGAGTLFFFSISDTMRLIHTVQTTFTQPLCTGFRVWPGSSVKLC